MCQQPKKLSDLTPDELRKILEAPIELTPEAQARHDRFEELLDRTTRWTWKDLFMLLR